MGQAARRLAWSSREVEQAEKQARVWADGLSSCTSASVGCLGEWSRAVACWPIPSQVERKNSWWLAEQAGVALHRWRLHPSSLSTASLCWLPAQEGAFL
jgi:hypothetical protein